MAGEVPVLRDVLGIDPPWTAERKNRRLRSGTDIPTTCASSPSARILSTILEAIRGSGVVVRGFRPVRGLDTTPANPSGSLPRAMPRSAIHFRVGIDRGIQTRALARLHGLHRRARLLRDGFSLPGNGRLLLAGPGRSLLPGVGREFLWGGPLGNGGCGALPSAQLTHSIGSRSTTRMP